MRIIPDSPRQPAVLTVLLFLLAAAICSCGYSNPYARLDSLEEGAQGGAPISIYVEMWQNNTSELGLQSEMTRAVVRWLKKSRQFTMAVSPEQADYTLRGVIESAHYPGLSYGTFDRAVELRAELNFSFELKNNRTGAVPLKSTSTPWYANYRTGTDAASTEINKRQALQVITDDIAEGIYINLYHSFASGGSKMNIPIEQPPEELPRLTR